MDTSSPVINRYVFFFLGQSARLIDKITSHIRLTIFNLICVIISRRASLISCLISPYPYQLLGGRQHREEWRSIHWLSRWGQLRTSLPLWWLLYPTTNPQVRERIFFLDFIFQHFSCQIIFKICTEHGSDTSMLCAKFQNDLTTWQ